MAQERKKITFFISSFRAGGGEGAMIDIANALSRRNYNISFLAFVSIGEYYSRVDKNIKITAFNSRRMLLSLPKIVFYLRKEKPDLVITVDEHASIYILIAKKIAGVQTRIILRVGTTYSRLFSVYKGIKNKSLPYFIRWLYKYADGVIAVSKGIADDIISVASLMPERVVTIYNPKQLNLIKEQMSEKIEHPWIENKEIPIIITAGRFRVPKNYELLIRAFAIISKNIPSRLIIVGKGRDGEKLKDLVTMLNCGDKVSFPGFTDNPYAWMSKADIFVLPSLWEGMPNALLEAMACGIAVISSDCSSGPREILAPNTDYRFRLKEGVEYAQYGVLTAVNDEKSLVQAMTKLLTDNELRAKYASLSSDRIKDFDSNKIIDEYAHALGLIN